MVRVSRTPIGVQERIKAEKAFNAKVQAAKERRLTALLGALREEPAVSAPRNHWPGRAPRQLPTRAAAQAVLIPDNTAGTSAANAAIVRETVGSEGRVGWPGSEGPSRTPVRGSLLRSEPLSNGPLRMEHSPWAQRGCCEN